jgi:hypothetical protein
MLKAPGRSIAVALVLAAGLMGNTIGPPPSLAETDRATESLRQVSRELTEAQRNFYTHLNQTIARHDRGYRLEDRRQIQSADADLTSGPADLMWAAAQKFTSFRMRPPAMNSMNRCPWPIWIAFRI